METIFFPLMVFISFNAIFVYFFNTRFEKTFPLSLICAVLILYLGGLVTHISYGFYIILLICIFAWILIIYAFFRKKEAFYQFIKNNFTIGFVVVVLLVIYVDIYFKNSSFTNWDEFMHWGPMARETMRLNQFYSVPEAILSIHKDYPPFATLVEVLWCKLGGNYFSEVSCYRGLAFFSLSLFLPLLNNLDIKKISDWAKGILFCLAVMILQTVVFALYFPSILDSLYIDTIMPLLGAYAIYSIFQVQDNKAFYYTNLACAFISLILVKQMGIFFYALALLCLLILWIKDHKFKKSNLKEFLIACGACIGLPAIFYLSWSFVKTIYQTQGQFSLSSFSVGEFFNICFNGGGLQWQQNSFNNFMNSLSSVAILEKPVPMSYIISIIVLIVIMISLILINHKRKGNLIVITSVYSLGAILYAVAMMLLYLFSFDSYEGEMLASYTRYMGSYVFFGLALLILMVGSKTSTNNKVLWINLCVIIITYSMLSQNNIVKLIPTDQPKGYIADQDLSEARKELDKYLKDGDSVLVEMAFSNFTVQIYEYLYPNNTFSGIALGTPKYEGDLDAKNLTFEQWKEYLKDYDYIYVDNLDAEFYEDYWLTISQYDPYLRKLYKIEVDGDTIRFILMCD